MAAGGGHFRDLEAAEASPGGRLSENVLHFGRLLRQAGLPIGPGRVLDAVRALETVGVGRREDVYWALLSVLVNRRDQIEIFDQAFSLFWQSADLERHAESPLPPSEIPESERPDRKRLARRLEDALMPRVKVEVDPETRVELEIEHSWSANEVLRRQDFETMTAEEMSKAKEAIAALRLPILEVPTRRYRTSARVPPHDRRADLRASMRAALRAGSGSIPLRWKTRRHRHPPLVVLCDISGSMSRYSRMLLHFLHAITCDRDRVHSFLFGTRLTNITRDLRQRDVDLAVERASERVTDWAGGTRIGACLRDFNRVWGRRVLGQGAVLLLITDGLDRESADGLAKEMERLHKSCRRLIWLNPLLRYRGYAPKSQGARAIMPHVDEFRSVHNLDSLSALSTVLSQPVPRRQEGVSAWMERRPGEDRI